MPERSTAILSTWKARALPAVITTIAIVAAGLGVITTLASAAGSVPVDPTATYLLVARGSGKALDVPAYSTADGTTLVQWSRTGGTTSSSGSSRPPAGPTACGR